MSATGTGRKKIGKATTTSALELDLRTLQRSGLISQANQRRIVSWSVRGVCVSGIDVHPIPNGVQLMYCRERIGHGRERVEQHVTVEPTACNFGGQRYWFRCPVAGCARRVAKLYLGEQGRFACRHCCRLVYESQRESKDIRAIRRAERVRERLGWRPGILNGHGSIPAGIHGQTYRRLVCLYDECVQRALEGHSRWLEGFRRRTN